MSGYHDPELEDVLQDDELRRIARLLGSARSPEPVLDDAFRTGLRHQLMRQAWAMTEGKPSWWRRVFAPPGLAWVGAAAGVLLIALVVVQWAGQGPGGPFQVVVSSNVEGNRNVALTQPILVHFNQPMDHASTEAAVQITPATSVAYSWDGDTLQVTPQSGNLAPNTQYQVTIGPGARTATQQTLDKAQTITFVTAAPPTPAPPPPRPTPTSTSLLTGERQLSAAAVGTAAPVQWAADSSALYFVDAKGALDVAPVNGGSVAAITPDGASSPAISPAGDKLAYIRGGKIEVLSFAAGKTAELSVAPQPSLVGWAQSALVWCAGDGVYTPSSSGGVRQLVAFPAGAAVTPISIAPDGGQVAYRQNQSLYLLDLHSSKSTQLGDPGASFLGWSPDGSLAMYSTGAGVVVADLKGKPRATLPSGDPSWSRQNAVLLGTDTDLVQTRPDGSGLTQLATGTYRSPAWAPNSSLFAFFRGGGLWVATAPPLPPAPTALDQATTAVKAFMDARLKSRPDQATAWLDAGGQQAYSASGMNLMPQGDPRFTRYYVLMSELVSTDPDTARFVVRLVLSHDKLDVSDYEETLTLVRDASSQQFLVDQASAGARQDLGKGAQVVNVTVSSDKVEITFDSDLDPQTIRAGVLILDAEGKPVDAVASYANRVVTFSGLDLKPGSQFKLAVLPSLRDVAQHNIRDEYDLVLVGPSGKHAGDRKPASEPAPPSPSPTPAG